jgi:DNA (cytosine-5)-methyltransferase 1
MPKLKVCELFAGVGGFRLGLEKTDKFEVIWSNQWEPSTKAQHASWVYEARFGSKNHSNKNIEEVPTSQIPDHDVLVGGFPCQDYSVATSLKNSKGLLGKKGVLWWSIHRILSEKENKPKYLILENVDRLLKSPSSQRGRDFAIMLKSLSELGYCVEWRVINAADYGMPQRRRRTFIIGLHKTSALYKKATQEKAEDWLLYTGIFAKVFPIKKGKEHRLRLDGNLTQLSSRFNNEGGLSPFQTTGFCFNQQVTTIKALPEYKGKTITIADILLDTPVDSDFFIPEKDLPKWEYLKGAKKEVRKTKTGFKYNYSEGSMIFPDPLNKPSRTIITGEGGKSPSRFKHVVQTKFGLRRLTPIELERLNMFPDNHTLLDRVSDTKRAFFMGNALIVGIVERLGEALFDKIKESTQWS